MGRRLWAWMAGTGTVLLLAAWVSGAGSITAFEPRPESPPATEEFGETFEPDQTDNATRGGPRGGGAEDNHIVTTVVVWTLRLLLVLIVLAVLYVVVRTLLRRLRRDQVAVKEAVRAGLLPDVLSQTLRDSEAELDRGTSSEAVINAWLALEHTAMTVGIDDDVSRTPAELVAEVLSVFDVDRNAIEELAGLYREARFSLHPIGEEHRESARQALQTIRAGLPSGFPSGLGSTTTGAGRGGPP